MGRASTRILVLVLLVSVCLATATLIQPIMLATSESNDGENVLKLLLGDGRRIFANHFFIKADVSFHSGYYPSVFDQSQAPKDSRHMTSQEGSSEEEEHERQMQFLGRPKDFIEAFGRHFLVTEHTHLEGGNEREILPWLKIAAELDPERVDTYTVAAYWLRTRLNKPAEAEQCLRDGLRHNPTSYELLFELGRLYADNYHDATRARNVWELGLRRWRQQEAEKKNPDPYGLEQIAVNLGHLEEQAGNLDKAVQYYEIARDVSPRAKELQQQIDELKQKIAAKPGATTKPGQP
jgi:tetratricopeptide (TPR) repeat protein